MEPETRSASQEDLSSQEARGALAQATRLTFVSHRSGTSAWMVDNTQGFDAVIVPADALAGFLDRIGPVEVGVADERSAAFEALVAALDKIAGR